MPDSSVTAKQAQQKQWMKQWYENNKEYCKEQAQYNPTGAWVDCEISPSSHNNPHNFAPV